MALTLTWGCLQPILISISNICIDEIFSGFTKSHPAYSKEEAMRLSDKWEEQILLIMRFLDWKKQIKK